jgi:uncharacterized membrane protein YkoI
MAKFCQPAKNHQCCHAGVGIKKMTKLSCSVHAPFMPMRFNGGVRIIKHQSCNIERNQKIMNLKTLVGSALVISLLAGCASEKSEQAELQAQAKISKEQAQQTALAKVTNGTVKEGELEKEKGKLIWSFDLTTPGSPNITEVNVDAITGEIVSVETETPAQQKKEKD